MRRGSSEPHRICVDVTAQQYEQLLAIADSALVHADFTIDEFCRDAIGHSIASFHEEGMRSSHNKGRLGPMPRSTAARRAW